MISCSLGLLDGWFMRNCWSTRRGTKCFLRNIELLLEASYDLTRGAVAFRRRGS
jgi:hypothetical protein